jgi:hypothetical protein
MRRFLLVPLLFASALPLCAATHTDVFDVPCSTLWPMVRIVIVNSGKHNIQIQDSHMRLYFTDQPPQPGQPGSSCFWCMSQANDALVYLHSQGDQCVMKTNTVRSAVDDIDAADIRKQLETMIENLRANPSAAPANGGAVGTIAAASPAAPQPQPASEQPAQTYSAPVAAPTAARITLAVTAHCAKDPDPIGFVSMSMYSGCKQKEMNELRSMIAGALTQRSVALVDGDNGDLRITVTMTKEEDKRPSSLMPFGDFMTGTYDFESIYQIADSSGRVLQSGNVTNQGPDSHPVDVEKQFAVKVADTLTSQLAALAPTAASGAAPPAATASAETPADLAAQANLYEIMAQANLYEIMAQAYRSLPVKPALPDDARLQKSKAEQAQQDFDAKAAKEAYSAALKSAVWWPEGMRGLALVLGSTGASAEAIVWMRRYLAFVPDAADAATMQAKISEWSLLTPPSPPLPTSLPAPPGLHLGLILVDTPGIVAMASGNPNIEGALVTLVFTGSEAETAGIAKGDIIVSFNGAPVDSAHELLSAVATSTRGATATLEVMRGQNKIPVKVQF